MTICLEKGFQLLKASQNLGICLIQWLEHMVKISSKLEVRYLIFQGGRSPLLGDYNDEKKLKLWKSALFSG